MGNGVFRHRVAIVAALGTTQTLAWASSYYLTAIVADPMAQALDISSSTVFAASRLRFCCRRCWVRT